MFRGIGLNACEKDGRNSRFHKLIEGCFGKISHEKRQNANRVLEGLIQRDDMGKARIRRNSRFRKSSKSIALKSRKKRQNAGGFSQVLRAILAEHLLTGSIRENAGGFSQILRRSRFQWEEARQTSVEIPQGGLTH